VFQFDFTQLMQLGSPMSKWREIVGHAFRQKNVPGIAAIHYALRQVDSRSGNIRSIVYIQNFVDRPAMNSHAQPNFWMTSQGLANFQRGPHGRFRGIKKDKGHSVPDRYPNQFPGCIRNAELFSAANNLIELLDDFALLVHQQLGVPDNVDEQDMRDLESKIVSWLGHGISNHGVIRKTLNAQRSTFNKNCQGEN
jgi:hypothetical protein